MSPELSRRETLWILAGVAGGAAGLMSSGPEDEGPVIGPIGSPDPELYADNRTIIGGSVTDALDRVEASTLLVFPGTGGILSVNSGVMELSGVEFRVHEDANFAEAEEAVDRFPTISITTGGNIYLFNEQ